MNQKEKIWVKSMEAGAKFGCHQRPDRSFTIRGYQFPVCARCTGIIASSIVALIVFPFRRLPLGIYAFLVAVMGLDGGLQYLHIKKSTNIRRFITGCMGGFGITSVRLMAVFTICKGWVDFLQSRKQNAN